MITDEAVEAAAKALFEVHPVSKGAVAWAQHTEGRLKQQFRADALAALEAAAPHMTGSVMPGEVLEITRKGQ
jgi:hypothetical protein